MSRLTLVHRQLRLFGGTLKRLNLRLLLLVMHRGILYHFLSDLIPLKKIYFMQAPLALLAPNTTARPAP